ncbi:MAG TPA: response regulator, partial [Chroococcidiopsis sp.]
PIHSILLDLGDASISTESLDFVMAIAKQNDAPPMVVITQPDTVSDRRFTELLQPYVQLSRPVSANALLRALTQAAHRTIASHKRVLVFDRDRPTLTHITNQLQGWGLQVTACHDASLIWDGLSPPRHDLLIMGIDLDENSPIELCRQLRNTPDWQSVPILIAAPYDTIEPLHRAFRNGATDILSKPVFAAELMARVLRILQRIP